MNNHYVPRLVLRKFADKLCLYNVKTGQFRENISIEEAYAQEHYYDYETEENLNHKIESQFGNLLSNIVLKSDKQVVLYRKQLLIIKKFLLISLMRVYEQPFVEMERNYYKKLQETVKKDCRRNNIPYNEGFCKPPFLEERTSKLSDYDYWIRTLNVILETNGTPQEIINHPDKTHMAYRWSWVVNVAYLAFWDAPDDRDEFVITDIGMTSENEKGWDGIFVHNKRKFAYLLQMYQEEKNQQRQAEIYRFLEGVVRYFPENFQMFPISSKRMIVLISPFFKIRYLSQRFDIPLGQITCIPTENLFKPNENVYVNPPSFETGFQYHPDDQYIYKVQTLSREEIRYCNALFMDRIDTYLGFSSLNAAVGSIITYQRLNAPPSVPRVDYTQLYGVIKKRYSGN